MRHPEELTIRSGPLLSRGLVFCLAVTLALSLVASPAKAAPAFTVTPTGLSFVAVEGGSNPPMQSVTIFTPGSEALSWFAASGVPWLQVIPPTGTTPSSALISANVTGLSPGTYSGTIFFTSSQTGASQVVFVSLMLTPQAPRSE